MANIQDLLVEDMLNSAYQKINENFHELNDEIAGHESAKDAEIADLQDQIDTESAARVTADNAEAQARANGDAAEAAARAAAISAEETARIVADNALQAQVSGQINAITALQNKDSQHDANLASLQTQITENEADIEAKYAAHVASTAAHNAENIDFTPGASGIAANKAGSAIKEVNERITQIVAGAGQSNTEILDARGGFATLKARLDETDTYQAAVNQAQAEIVRQSVHSGFIDAKPDDFEFLPTVANKIRVRRDLVAYVFGFKLTIASSTEITLPDAPTYGAREDLVFLEAWFPQSGPRGVLSMRLRTVAGVDFAKFPDGLGILAGTLEVSVTPQGGNSAPVVDSSSAHGRFWKSGFYYTNGTESPSAKNNNAVFGNDLGIFVAGLGNSASKAALLTADGYVYALPMLRVPRRNSGGYRADNVNGARDFYSVGNMTTTATIEYNANGTATVAQNYDLIKVGDTLVLTVNTGVKVLVISKDSGNTITIKNIRISGTPITAGSNQYQLESSGRPDGLFSNIIDQTDIGDAGDLRRRVSLTGFNYAQLLDENADKLVRGERGTKRTVRETYGLTRAPFYVQPELRAIRIKRADGSEIELKNLIGVRGKGDSFSGWDNVDTGYSISTTQYKYSSSSFYLNTATAGNRKMYIDNISLNPSGYYAAVVDSYYVDGINQALQVYDGGGFLNVLKKDIDSSKINQWQTLYVKITGKSAIRLAIGMAASATGQSYWSGLRLYEIDQATYNLIDSDPAWTGGDKLAALFPYVDSLPNVVENLFNKDTATLGRAVDVNGSLINNTGFNASDFIPVSPNQVYHQNQGYVSSGTRRAYYDSSMAFISSDSPTAGLFTTQASCAYVRISIRVSDMNMDTFQITKGDAAPSLTVPFGKWYIPADYQGFNAHLGNNSLIHYAGVNGSSFDGQRRTFSDAQTSETVYDTAEALRTPQRHISVSQATEGTWAIGDTIKVKTFDGTEIQADPAPVVTAPGIAGTWTGLGTKEATYTISTAPSAPQSNILLSYSVNYSAGKGVANLPADVLGAEVNGQKLVSGSAVSLKDNFTGKQNGSNDACPHIAKAASVGALLAPSGAWVTPDMTTVQYGQLSVLDGTLRPVTDIGAGKISQTLFSFNMVEIVERKYGEGVFSDCADLAAKVAKLKIIVSKITCNWWGFGSNPNGSAAAIAMFRTDTSVYDITKTHAFSTVALLTTSSTAPTSRIDSNGFVHAIAYGYASDGVIASTINTDYVEIEVELNVAEAGYSVFQPENPFPVFSENMLSQNQAFPVDTTSPTSTTGWMIGGAAITSSTTILEPGILQFARSSSGSGNEWIVCNPSLQNNAYYTFVGEAKGSGSIQPSFYDGSTNLVVSPVQLSSTEWNKFIITKKMATTGVPNVAIFTQNRDGTSFQVRKLAVFEGTVEKVWTPGRKKKVTLNLLGKIAGSTVEITHRSFYKTSATFDAPSTFALEASQADYDSLARQDGVLASLTAASAGQYPMRLIELDLSHLGMSLGELRKALRTFSAAVVVNGVGDNSGAITNGVTAKVWDNPTSSWATFGTGTSGTLETLTWTNSVNAALINRMNTSQKVYLLVHTTYPASETNAATLYMDYAKLDVTLADYVDLIKSNIVKVRPETREVKLAFPARSYRLVGGGANPDVVTLNYRYVPRLVESIGTPDKELTKPTTFFISTLGTGGPGGESRALLTQILTNAYEYAGQSLFAFLSKGVKQLPFDTDDLRAAVPDVEAPYIAFAFKLVVKSGQLYLRILYRESKEIVNYVDLTKTVDIPLLGRPLVRGA